MRAFPSKSLPLFLAPLLLHAAVSRGAEGTDPPVLKGLIHWLDPSAQASLRKSASLPSLPGGGHVDFLIDSAAPALVWPQPSVRSRPTFRAAGTAAYLDFDGEDDFLCVSGPRRLVRELTVLVLAAPRSNAGLFRGLFAATEAGRNDYTNGLNLDLGPTPTKDLSVLNVESSGAGGFRDLLEPGFFNAKDRPFGGFHVFTVTSRVGKEGTRVFLDGYPGGIRDRLESLLGIDQLAVGARLYSNEGLEPPHAQGFLDGAVAQVLVYDRVLEDDERKRVEEWLLEKTVAVEALLQGKAGHPLQALKDPPIVQMLVPGFTVDELPVKLTNVNNLRYRHDGALVALGYDGRIHLLTDSDGDGLEDRARAFWDQASLRAPLGMALTPAGDSRGDGVLVASKGKVSLVLDRDRDGHAEEEVIAASGWKESFHNVDTVGLAVDPRDGSIYFGLGCANFANPYLLDGSGRSAFDLADPHGTIQRLAADFSRRETIATGLRFTCALAFNAAGDLFATDQEGATWLPNGNPLDELIFIERGKHYGFPPRHPGHLPGVIDEPAVEEYGPQHQSTVGLTFNEGTNGGPTFGPAHWKGDAIVCGESRGKLWRTRLVKTPRGYVAQTHLIACLGLLTVEACVSPRGDLLVACHSGPPDWGTGPAGEGRIFRIHHGGPTLPQPVLAWAAAPDELRVAFDRPLDPADWARARESCVAEAGAHVSAGDHFEGIRPGYQVVRDQLALPRRWVEVLGLTLTADHRTLVLRIPRQSEPVGYSIQLPLPPRWKLGGGIPQHPTIELCATLQGVEAVVKGQDGSTVRGILPHVDPAVAAHLTEGSAEHSALLGELKRPGASVEYRGLVDVSNPRVPPVQPGSTLDWDPATDPVTAEVFTARIEGGREEAIALEPAGGALKRFRLTLASGVSNPSAGLSLAGKGSSYPVSPRRLLVPWAELAPPGAAARTPRPRTDVHGSWIRGRELFHSTARCAECHAIRGEGTPYGPDLSNLVHRDRDSVLTDLLKPSATINPDQAGTQLVLDDGSAVTGLLRRLNAEEVSIDPPTGPRLTLPRVRVAQIEPLAVSLMPEGLGQVVGERGIEDLLTFLLVSPIDPAVIARVDPPPPLARAALELKAVLGPRPGGDPAPLRLLLVAGPKDHGLDEHDYPLWLDRWSRLLALGQNVAVEMASTFPTAEQLSRASVAVFFNANPGWSDREASLLDAFHERGGGAVYLHYAINGGSNPDTAAERMGLVFAAGSRFRHGPLSLVWTRPDHPITRALPPLEILDESYWALRGDPGRVEVLGTSVEEGAPRPQVWTLERKRSRIVGCIPGHYTWTFDDPLVRVLMFRSICWAARIEDVDRLRDLVTVGARLATPAPRNSP